jgi:hypothetical protein
VFRPWYRRSVLGLLVALYDWVTNRDAAESVSARALPRVRAQRAVEVDDLIWPNLWAKGRVLYDVVYPMLTWCIILASLVPTAYLVFNLTAFKLELSSSNQVDESSLAGWLIGNVFPDEGTDAVIIAAMLTSAVVMVINLGLRALLGQIATRLERPFAKSKLQARVMTISSVIYICNYVLVIYVAQSPLNDDTDYASMLRWAAMNRTSVITKATVMGSCAHMAETINPLNLTTVEGFHDSATSCINAVGGAVTTFYVQVLETLVRTIADHNWYDVSGLIPQIIVLAVTDIIVLSFMSVGISLAFTIFRRINGRLQYSQANMNHAYRPPEFTLGDKCATRRSLAF